MMDKSLRIAHIGWVASCHLVRRVDELAARGVRGVVFTDSIPDHFDPDAHAFAVERLPEELFDTPLNLVRWLEDRLAALDMDLLHAHSTHFPASLAYFVRTVPVVNSPWDFVNSKDPLSPLFNRAILEELARGRLADAVSFSSKPYMDEVVAKGLPRDRAFWHSWGVDLATFAPGRHARAATELRRSLGIAPDEIMILSPRTPSLPANVDIAMQAVAELAGTHPVRLVVTGHHITRESGYYERLAARPDIAASTIFLDTVRGDGNIATLYEASDVVLSIHSNDYNPATVLESFAMERPVLVHDLPTVAFWVEDGVNGWTVPQRDVAATAARLDGVLRMDRNALRTMGRAGRKRVLAQADLQRTMDQLPGDYRSVIESARRSPRPALTSYDIALLHDIRGQSTTAMHRYLEAISGGEDRTMTKDLLEEKAAMNLLDNGLEYFCTHRCQPVVRLMALNDPALWPELAERLPIPMSLFRHDYVAGILPLLQRGRFDRALALLRCLADRFQSDLPEWVGETVILFGRRFGQWRACAELLAHAGPMGATLADLADEATAHLDPYPAGEPHLTAPRPDADRDQLEQQL